MKRLLPLALFFAATLVAARAQEENKDYEAKIVNDWLALPAQSNITESSDLRLASVPVEDNGRNALMLQADATVVINGHKRHMTVQFYVYANDTYRVAGVPLFKDYVSPDQEAQVAEAAKKQEPNGWSPGEGSFAHYMRTGNLAYWQSVQGTPNEIHAGDTHPSPEAIAAAEAADARTGQKQASSQTQQAAPQPDEQAQKVRAEQELAQRQQAKSDADKVQIKALQVSVAASRLFVANWKPVTGAINPVASLSIFSPSVIEPFPTDAEKGHRYIFRVAFSTPPSPKPNPELALAGASLLPRTGASSGKRDMSLVRKLSFNAVHVEGLQGLVDLIEKFKAWSKTASDNHVTAYVKALGVFGPAQLTFAVNESGAPSLRWEQGMVKFSQTEPEVEATEAVITSALGQVSSLEDDCQKRAISGETVQSKDDLFK